jgi:hypothetical protein
MPSLLSCTCTSEACTCSDPFQTGELDKLAAKTDKGSQMSILEKMKAAGIKLDDIKASASSLPLADLKALNKALADEVRAQEEKTSKKALRLQRLRASMENQADDLDLDSCINRVRHELRRLGYNIDACGKDGLEPREIHKRGKAEGWDGVRITRLTIDATALGLME